MAPRVSVIRDHTFKWPLRTHYPPCSVPEWRRRHHFEWPPSLTPATHIRLFSNLGKFCRNVITTLVYLSASGWTAGLYIGLTLQHCWHFSQNENADKYDEGGPNIWFPMSTPHQDPSRWLLIKSWEFLPSEGRNPLGTGQVNTAKNAITFKNSFWLAADVSKAFLIGGYSGKITYLCWIRDHEKEQWAGGGQSVGRINEYRLDFSPLRVFKFTHFVSCLLRLSVGFKL